MYMHQKIIKNGILPLQFFMKFDQRPCTIVQGLSPGFGATLKFHKNSNFDKKQFKIEKQHKDMYMHQEKL